MRRWILGLLAALTLALPMNQATARDLYQIGDIWIWIGGGDPPPGNGQWIWTGFFWVWYGAIG
jgi:hypothetical protein